MSFSSALRESRLSSLARPLRTTPKFNRGTYFPTEQVISTTPAAFSRRNWGLKSSIPEKHKSIYIKTKHIFSENDWVPYEPGAGPYRHVQRFAEMGVPLEFSYPFDDSTRGTNKQVLFHPVPPKARRLDSLTKKQFEKVLSDAKARKPEFLEYLKAVTGKDAHSDLPLSDLAFSVDHSRANLSKFAADFCHLAAPTIQGGRREYKASVPGLGLSYQQKGVLHNSPSGFQVNKSVKARSLQGMRTAGSAASVASAVGGFVGEVSLAFIENKTNDIRKNIRDVAVTSAQATAGSIRIHGRDMLMYTRQQSE